MTRRRFWIGFEGAKGIGKVPTCWENGEMREERGEERRREEKRKGRREARKKKDSKKG